MPGQQSHNKSAEALRFEERWQANTIQRNLLAARVQVELQSTGAHRTLRQSEYCERTLASHRTCSRKILQSSTSRNVIHKHFPPAFVDYILRFGFCRTLRLSFGLRTLSGRLLSTLTAAESEAHGSVRARSVRSRFRVEETMNRRRTPCCLC
jgi:hypothetical protein